MTRYQLIPILAVSLLSSASAQTLLFLDSFNNNAPLSGLDSSVLDGRRTGTEASLMLRSSMVQQLVLNNELYMFGTGGRVRFQTDTSNWANWAALPSSAAILSAGGLTVDFDIAYAFNQNPAAWIGFAAGFMDASAGEPTIRTSDVETDYGFMIGKDGTYTRYANGAAIGDPVFGSAAGSRHVKLEYVFNSFADGTPVIVRTSVDGQVMSYDTFTWNNNGGQLFLELENRGGDTYFDNVQVSTSVLYKIDLTTDGYDFRTGAPAARSVGMLSAETLKDASGFEDSTYVFVAGDGDTDNSKFTINSSGELVTTSYNFKQGATGKTYSVRVKATGKKSGQTTQQIFTLTPVKDDDNDQLPDDWELMYSSSLTNLTGLLSGPGPGAGTGDYDGDGIPDLQEYYNWLTTPGYSPVSLDSDGDGISDTDEVNPTGTHVVTDPTLADTDGDGISDSAEYAGGTSPILGDTDGDGYRDGYELAHGSNPNEASSRPALPAGITLVQLTDDASSGISATKTYTHHVSGGTSAVINGVTFDALTPSSVPANFDWSISAGDKASMTTATLNDWVPASGGVTGPGVQDLFDNFAYGTANSNVTHTYTLSGLTPGQTYTSKLFIRMWAKNTTRAIDLSYTNGSDTLLAFDAINYDQPGVVLNNGNNNSAYYVSYTYVAKSTSLVITAATPPHIDPNNGGAHFYALTNEVVGTAVSALKITGVTRSSTGSLTLTIKGAPSTTYQVTKSANLTTYTALTTPLSVTTDASGNATAVVPATEATTTKGFFRIELP